MKKLSFYDYAKVKPQSCFATLNKPMLSQIRFVEGFAPLEGAEGANFFKKDFFLQKKSFLKKFAPSGSFLFPQSSFKIKSWIIFWTLFACCGTMTAQLIPNLPNSLFLNVSYSAQLPAGELANRFGFSMSAGTSVEYFWANKNLIIGSEAYYLFGQTVKEDVLSFARTTEGEILGDIGTYAQVDLRQRGYYWGGHIGRFFKTNQGGNQIGGLRVTLGGGFLQHYIRIQDNQNVSIAQLSGAYRAGYDRLTNGFSLNQFIGWQVLSRNKQINFHIGLELTEGFTKNRRGFNFDTGLRDDKTRLDMLYALKFGWMLPFWSAQKASEIEY